MNTTATPTNTLTATIIEVRSLVLEFGPAGTWVDAATITDILPEAAVLVGPGAVRVGSLEAAGGRIRTTV